MARESIVLLQNDGILPLAEDVPLAVVGPNADDTVMLWGNYNPIPSESVTLLSGIRERQAGAVYVKGCGHIDGAEDFSRDRDGGVRVGNLDRVRG